ncbi:MAG: VWA domain-containing protein, partial [Planctomycetes bacterium]|nr:VWA domain-containing protein [Planctomycetota bacterium]
DPEWFDSSVLVARKGLKRLYALLHIRPGERAQRILFDRDPPPDSRLFALRELAKAESPAEQARAIVQHRIPYRVAATVIKQMTPTVLLALIERMSPQELINNLGALKRRGALDHPDLKALIEEKLEEAKTAERVSAFKAEEAIRAADVSREVQEKLESVADAQVKAKGRIARPTALLIDKSGSMEQAIELGKRIGAMISAICDSDLFVYAFDTVAYPIARQGGDLADWERAFQGIRAGQPTSCGIALANMRRKKQRVEQIVLITDEGENTPPLFVEELKQYREELETDVNVVIVRTPGGTDQLERECRLARLLVDVFQFAGDYYALPNLIPLLTRPSKVELLMEIMEYPLPRRRRA